MENPHMPRARLRHILTIAIAALLAAAPAANAQWGIFRMLEKPPVTSEAPRLMDRIVNLDEEQAVIVTSFQQEAQAEYERVAAIWKEIREDAEQEARTSDDRTVWFELFARARDFEKRRAEIRENFMENASLVITADQQEDFERFERRFFRQHLFGEAVSQYGSVAGVTVDVEDVAESADLSDSARAAIEPTLVQYSRQIHGELVSLKDAADTNAEARMEAFEKMAEGEGWDMELMSRGMDRIASLVEDIRQTNLTYERRIANELSGDDRAEFQRVFNRTAFPGIYTDTAATARFRAALGMEDLSEEQRTTLRELQTQFEREVSTVRQELREAALDENPVENMMRGGWGRGSDDEEEEEARETVNELSERFVQQIDAVLTPDQRQTLGENDPTDWRTRSFDP